MKLSRVDAEQRVKGLNGWTLDDDAIRKQYTFANWVVW
jgi:pterin-4a-carbinolamine dehydratase